ncbi:uncharacterized protein [Leptinotarsa decemlineata]|uniref:uncharacterized protein n=1 Tax=Leptinotarsa decemlineata TaxID=7539 RepID=UPI003D30B67A
MSADETSESDTDYVHTHRIRKKKNSTGRLDGMEVFPEPTVEPRKRFRCPSKWARTLSKEKRARGESYVSSRKKVIPAIQMKPPCQNCRSQCNSKISEEERNRIFSAYYALGEYSRQRDFIHANTEKLTKKRITADNSKRNFTVTFYLPSQGKKVKVCKTMFLNTLGIKKGVVDIAMKKRTTENTNQEDKRGRHIKKQTPPDIVQNVKAHIESFPVMPSHYCRATTKRLYLDQSLNVNRMYNMYIQVCSENDEPKATLPFYRKIFNECYNLGFHHPKKDQCRVCSHYTNASSNEKDTLKEDYTKHLQLKERARTEKMKDKEEAQNSNGESVCANFDLQQVLLVPSDPANNALFYKRRLATYNFTIYTLNSQQGFCYMWDQTQGGRGSCEIASCVHLFLKGLLSNVKNVVFYSDRCGGQNLNQFIATMFMIAVQELDNISVIDMKFLVPGHTQMECDSMHSAVATELQRVGKASWPEDLKQIARSARRKGDKPYQVFDLLIENINDYKLFMKENLTNRKKGEDSEEVRWQKMSWMRFEKSEPYKMKFRENFDEPFKILDFNKRSRRHTFLQLKQRYDQPIPITSLKYRDLVSLFTLKPPALGDRYKQFYLDLPHDGDVGEPECDFDDSDNENL